jgi:hypothetical protein
MHEKAPASIDRGWRAWMWNVDGMGWDGGKLSGSGTAAAVTVAGSGSDGRTGPAL